MCNNNRPTTTITEQQNNKNDNSSININSTTFLQQAKYNSNSNGTLSTITITTTNVNSNNNINPSINIMLATATSTTTSKSTIITPTSPTTTKIIKGSKRLLLFYNLSPHKRAIEYCSLLFTQQQYSRCSFSVLLRWVNAIKVWANAIKVWANAIKVWANAIKIQYQHKKSANIVLGNWKFKIFETWYEYFNTLSKHFVECKILFLVFVLIWHFNSIAHTLIALAHPNSTEKLQRLQ